MSVGRVCDVTYAVDVMKFPIFAVLLTAKFFINVFTTFQALHCNVRRPADGHGRDAEDVYS